MHKKSERIQSFAFLFLSYLSNVIAAEFIQYRIPVG